MNRITTYIAAYSKTNKDWLDEAVESVRQQGVEPYVVYDERITHYKWSEQLKICQTEYLHLFSHDDVLLPDFYHQTVSYLDRNPELAAVFTMDYIINERGERIGQTALPFGPMESYDFRFILNNIIRYGNFLRCPSVVFRVSSVRNLEYPECDSASDTAMWFNVLKNAGPIGIIPKPLFLYRQASSSDTQKNIIGTMRQWDHVRALEYAVSLDPEALDWDTYIGYHKALADKKQAEEFHRVQERTAQATKTRLIVVHEPPDNAGTGVIAAHRVREVNASTSGEVAFYVYPDTQNRTVRNGWEAGCPCIVCHPTLFGSVLHQRNPEVIEFHHTLVWGDGILNVPTAARKELYLHDLWMWRNHPHQEDSGKRDTQRFIAGVQGVYANGPWLQKQAKENLGNYVGLFQSEVGLPLRKDYEKVIGYFGGFHPTKGVGVLLQAMRRMPRYLLVMFSNLPDSCLNGRRVYGHDNVLCLGGYSRPDLPYLAMLVDVVAVPSLFESYGLVKREIESLGVPVISTHTGGMAGNIEPNDIDSLVEALNHA